MISCIFKMIINLIKNCLISSQKKIFYFFTLIIVSYEFLMFNFNQFKKQMVTVTLLAKYLYLTLVPFVLLRITGNKKTTRIFLSQLLLSVTKSMFLQKARQKTFMQEILSKNWHQSSMDVVVVNQTWPWQEEATKLKSKNCWMQQQVNCN